MRDHEQDNSTLALSRFVSDHDLADNQGVVRYKGTVRFEYGQHQEEKFIADIQIVRDNTEFKVQLLDGIPYKFPAKFVDHFDEIEYRSYGPLVITGDYQHSKLGKYTAYIYQRVI